MPSASESSVARGVALPVPAPRSSPTRWFVPAGLFLLALAVRALLAALHPDPGYPDSAYYVDIARSIASGHGFSENFLWTFIDVGGRIPANAHLPVPSNAHWAPLASMVQVPFIWLLGPTQLASLLPFVLVGALAAPLAWAIARDAGSPPLVALGAGILGAVPGLATVFMAQPDNFALTMVLGGAALWLTSRGLRGHGRSFVGAGLLIGLATLARTDGILLAAAPAAAFAWDRWRARRGGHDAYLEPGPPGAPAAAGHPGQAPASSRAGAPAGRPAAIPFAAAAGCALAFLVVVGPWWIRQLAVFGSLSPSTGAGILWLRSFAELNSVTAPRTLQAFLGQPIGDLVGSRVGGLAAAVEVFVVIVCALVLAPFAVAGWWRRRRSVETGPWLVAALVLLTVSTLLFAIHVPNGMFLHASVALAPHTYWLAMEGIVGVAGWVAARRGGRSVSEVAGAGPVAGAGGARAAAHAPTMALARVLAAGILAVVVAGSALAAQAVGNGWESRLSERRVLADAIERIAAPGDLLMSIDTATFEYLTGHGGVVTPDDPLPVIEQAARAYDIRWLVLERDGVVRALAPVLDGTRPTWIGLPVFQLAGPVGGGSAGVVAAIYPVCIHGASPGCTAGGTAWAGDRAGGGAGGGAGAGGTAGIRGPAGTAP